VVRLYFARRRKQMKAAEQLALGLPAAANQRFPVIS